MKSYKSIFLFLCLTLFFGCNEDAPVTELEFSKRASGANSSEAFRNTVHPILLKRCATCHGDSGSVMRHSVSDYKQSHDIIVDGGKVNFANPNSSRIVDKIVSQRHNCWDNDCEASAKIMLGAVKEWIELRGAAPARLAGATTQALMYNNAEKRLPEPVDGSLLMQAEDGKLTGRMKTHTNSKASGFTYIAGDNPPAHPIEQTARIGSVNGSCKIVSPTDLANTLTGRYRLSEPRRHINQEGYRYYSQRVRFRIIRPSKRTEYQAEIKAGRTGTANLQKFFFADGPYNEDDGMLDGNVQEGGNPVIRVLPEFMEHADYVSKIFSNNITDKNFFAPRFGNPAIDYFGATNLSIRAGLPTYLKSSMVFRSLDGRFKSYFYDYNTTTKAWVPENNIKEVPFSMRTIPDGLGGFIPFQINNQVIADKFYKYYFNELTRDKALNPVSGTDSTHLIDTYVHYYMDIADRDFANFTWSYKDQTNTEVSKTFTLARGNTNLDLSGLLADNSLVDSRAIMTENYGKTLYPIVRANCIECHGDGSGRPQFALGNKSIAFDSMIGFVNFGEPGNSRPATRMDEGHNCGASCASLKAEMVSAINAWSTKNTEDIEAAKSNSEPQLKSLSAADRSPARVRYTVNVKEAGEYNVWLKVLTTNTKRRFRIRILDDKERPMRNCASNTSCNTSEETFKGKTADEIDTMSCRLYDTGTHPEWSWYTPNINNLAGRIKWNLGKGKYHLEIIEDNINAKIDLIALSKNPEFNPAKNLIDEGLIATAEPRILKYDISGMIGSPGFFEIEILEKNGGDSYIFRNPHFVGNTKNIKVKNIKILVNDKYEFTDSSYTKIDAIVGKNAESLTYAPLVALSINGLGSDSFKFVFEDLQATSADKSIDEDDAPVAVEGRKCQNLALFQATVMPVLNRLRLVRKDDDGYTEYTADDRNFPGTDRDGANDAQFYTCTTCHNEEHPYFKMTTFFNKPEVLCEQALSRVDFGNFERSLLLRGLNGTFNHPKLHFVESVGLTGSGNSRRFRTNPAKVNGFDSSWAGLRFEKYKSGSGVGEINLGAYSGAQRDYLNKFVGQYKRTRPVRINDPFSVMDGETRLPGDSYNALSPEIDKWTYATGGRDMFTVIDPEDFVNKQDDFRPESLTSGDLMVKGSCIDVKFNELNGVVTDPCNSNVDVTSEFEIIKARYRNSIINWMKEEKKSYNK